MTINSGSEALQKRLKPRDQIINEAVNKVAGAKRVTEAQKKKCENRRKLEFLEEEKRLMKMFALELE